MTSEIKENNTVTRKNSVNIDMVNKKIKKWSVIIWVCVMVGKLEMFEKHLYFFLFQEALIFDIISVAWLVYSLTLITACRQLQPTTTCYNYCIISFSS